MDITISVTKTEIDAPFEIPDGFGGTYESKKITISSHDIYKVSTEELMDVYSGLNVSASNVKLELKKRGVVYGDPINQIKGENHGV
jgi:hypothetical protein